MLLAVPLALVGVWGHRSCTVVERPTQSAEGPVIAGGDPALPGLGAGDGDLMTRLDAALRAKGPRYVARTHHLRPDGGPRYVNRLILESSPYLLQHAHNPVNWFPWSAEAFARARAEGKPVLLSVGYSTCHWCHVMERESFEDETIARFINENYVAIKVDREERPDVDDVYMKAVQALTGRGGWPMTVVMTPDGDPFFGGTHFPARDGDRGVRKGFHTILRELATEYATKRGEVVARAQEVSQQIEAASTPSPPGDVPGAELVERAVSGARASFDATWGGFGRAPKFPRPVLLDLLLRYQRRAGDAQTLEMVTVTLDKMASGGMYDHVGGGFHRYSTDARWLVPHFEKMLYDNAQLVPLYLEAYQTTGRDRFAQVARHTLQYVVREMTAPGGAFFSATDADSRTPSGHEEEGYFFTWTPSEVRDALGTDEARAVLAYFAVTAAGNFEKRSILHTPRSDETVAAELGTSSEELGRGIARAREALYQARSKRPRPLLDDKILTSWNGLMITAFARGALVLSERDYAARAAHAADFVLGALRKSDGGLFRTYKDGRASQDAFLDDYACMIQGLLDLFEVTADGRRVEQAIALQAIVDERFWDASGGGYFMTSHDHERLLARDKPTYDGAEPSGNAVALMNLLRLSEITTRADYRTRAERGFAAFSRDLSRTPTASPRILAALDTYLDRPREIFIVRKHAHDDVEPLMGRVRSAYLPNRVLVVATEGAALDSLAKLVPALEGKLALKGRPTAYVCERGRCELPTADPRVFGDQLAKVTEWRPGTAR